MIRFGSVIELTSERRQLLTVGLRGGLEPTQDPKAAALSVRNASDPASTEAVQFGSVVVFEVTFAVAGGRPTTRKSVPYLVKSADGDARGDVTERGRLALYPTRSADGTSRVVAAIVATPRVIDKPAATSSGDASPTGTTNTNDTGTSDTGTGGTSTTPTTSTSSGSGSGGDTGDDDMPFLGETRMFSGNFAPRG